MLVAKVMAAGLEFFWSLASLFPEHREREGDAVRIEPRTAKALGLTVLLRCRSRRGTAGRRRESS